MRWIVSPADVQQRNIRNVLIDGIGVGLVNGIGTFLAVFLIRLGASPFLVGLLTSLPALTGILLAFPIGRLLERQRNVVPWYSRSRVWVLGSYALIGVVPFFFSNQAAPIAILLIWAAVTIPQTIVNVAFTVVMGAVAGPDKRYYLMSRRWSVLGITTAISVAIAGVILDLMSFPLNYQVVFIASFVGGMVSFIFSSQIIIPDNEVEEEPAEQQSWRERIREGVGALRENVPFSQFVISQFVFRFGMALAMPIFPLYWVRDLNASDSWIGVINTVQSAVLLGAYFIWSSLTQKRGAVTVLRICTLGIALYPLFTGLTRSVLPLPVYAGMAGVFNAGIDLVLFDILLSTTPKRHNASYIALYQLTNYLATFLAPFLGTALGDAFGYSTALFVASGLRFVGLGLFILYGVGVAQAPPEEAASRP